MPKSVNLSRNMSAFLDMIAKSEGTSTAPYTKNDGYDVIVNGVDSPHVFNNYATHPDVLVTVNCNGLKSTAAGRYQLLYRYWLAYKQSLNLPDFSPVSQDRIAIEQIKERGALADIESGHIQSAISKCSNIWASLPGNNYQQGQRSIAWLVVAFNQSGGSISA